MTKPLSVLLIDDNPARAEIVEAGLAAAGYRLLARLEGTQDLIGRVRELEPDVVVVSTDSPSRDAIEDMRRSTEQQPRPIALFVDRSDPATIAAAMEAGVSAYVVKGLARGPRAARRRRRGRPLQPLPRHARGTRSRAPILLERKSIDRAKGLLMEQKGLSEEAAYKLLRKLAMDQNKRIGEVAHDIVTYAKVLEDRTACTPNDHAAHASIRRPDARRQAPAARHHLDTQVLSAGMSRDPQCLACFMLL